eukprot:9278131-Pyramimonas_sp.AAC.1
MPDGCSGPLLFIIAGGRLFLAERTSMRAWSSKKSSISATRGPSTSLWTQATDASMGLHAKDYIPEELRSLK